MNDTLTCDRQFFFRMTFLITLSFLLRAIAFAWFVYPNTWYHQPDSMDYHITALTIATGNGMYHPSTKKPIFWRTPGYGWFLSHFYKMHGVRSGQFDANKHAQKAAIWMQIILSSLVPILVYILAFLITRSSFASFVTAAIFAVHIGFVLASSYLLTESLAVIFFFLFLIAVYYVIADLKYTHTLLSESIAMVIGALMLGAYTWLRPHGQWFLLFVLAALLMTRIELSKKILLGALFTIIFLGTLAPWCMRNQQLTGHYFFCPMSGPYFLSFCAPKILRRIYDKPLDQCMQTLFRQAKEETAYQEDIMRMISKDRVVCHELICSQFSVPWLYKYPHYFIVDWVREVLKSTFDLYSYQMVSMVHNVHTFDPLEEFLTTKTAECLYTKKMPIGARIIAYLELLYMIFLWVGVFGALYRYILIPIIAWLRDRKQIPSNEFLVLIITFMFICGTLCMTGGFGYARLRMPIEPLMVIVSLMWWYRLCQQKKNNSTVPV